MSKRYYEWTAVQWRPVCPKCGRFIAWENVGNIYPEDTGVRCATHGIQIARFVPSYWRKEWVGMDGEYRCSRKSRKIPAAEGWRA